MKQLKGLLSFLIAVIFIMSLAMIPAFAEDGGKIVGDCDLLLPKDGTIKVQYRLKDAGGTAVSGATYTVGSTSNTKGSVADFAVIDPATGVLYINANAKGQEFKVTASNGTVEGSLIVTTRSECYCTDFETIPDFFVKGKTVTETPDYDTILVSDGNGGHYANISGGNWSTENADTALKIDTKNLTSGYLTIKGRVKVKQLSGTAGNGNPTNTSTDSFYAVKLNYDPDVKVYNTANEADNGKALTNYLALAYRSEGYILGQSRYYISSNIAGQYLMNSAQWNEHYITDKVTANDFVEFQFIIDGQNDTTTVRADGETNGYRDNLSNLEKATLKYMKNNTAVSLSEAAISNIAFTMPLDDLEIYSGEKVSGTYEILGDATIYRAQKNSGAKISYTAKPILPWENVLSNLTWCLKSAYNGVTMDADGTLHVSGAAPAGTVTVQVKSGDTVLGEKLITVKKADWIEYTENLFDDFESSALTVGQAPISGANYGSNQRGAFNYFTSTNAAVGIEPYVRAETTADGKVNHYISAARCLHWGTTGCTLQVLPRNSLPCADYNVVTFDGKFRANTARLQNNTWSLMCLAGGTGGDDLPIRLDIRYRKIAEGIIGIYNYMVDGVGNQTNNPKLIAVVPADEWFDARAEFDTVNETYDFYIDDMKVVDGEKWKKDNIANVFVRMYIGSDVDDIAHYNGRKDKVAQTGSGVTVFEDGKAITAGAADKIPFASSSEAKTVSAGISLKNSGLTAENNAKLIIAYYDAAGKLVDTAIEPVTITDAGVAAGSVALSQAVGVGDYAKVFLWNMDKVQPLQ